MNGSRGDSAGLWFRFMVRRYALGLSLGCRASLAITRRGGAVLEGVLRIMGGVLCTAPFVLSLVVG